MSPVLPENGFNLQSIEALEAFANYENIANSSIEMYGFGTEFREFTKLPPNYPLNVKSQHGIVLLDKPENHELNSRLPVMFVQSKRMWNAWGKLSKKKCFVIKSPFYTYRKRHNLKQLSNAKGSIFFVSHTTFWNKSKLNVPALIKLINDLPEHFKPVSICLHFVDIKKGLHKSFLEAGFTCFTAGNHYNKDFIRNFYSFLPRFKYVLTNHVGSYVFYAVDLDIPVSLVGESPEYEYVKEGYNEERKSHSSQYPMMKYFEELLGNNRLNINISEDLRQACKSELGIEDGLDEKKMKKVLMYARRRYQFQSFLKTLKNKIRLRKFY